MLNKKVYIFFYSILIGIKYVNGYLVFILLKVRLLVLKFISSFFFVKIFVFILKVNILKCMLIFFMYLYLYLKYFLIWFLFVCYIVFS